MVPDSPPSRAVSVAAALLEKEGRFLVAQRSNGLWEFPGGKQEPGESLGQALVREMKEELDLTVAAGQRFTTVRHSYPDKTIELHFYWCGLVEGAPRCLDCLDWRWVSLEEMEGFEFMEADTRVIELLLKVKK